MGAASLAAGIGLAVTSVLLIDGMTGNLVSEAVGILIDIAIFSLILERISAMQRRREWDFAYRVLIESTASAFVDVMRILYVRSSLAAFSSNIDRHEEFVKLAMLHAATLRSNIEGFATALTPEAHSLCRRTEQRLLWMIDRLSQTPSDPVAETQSFSRMNQMAMELVDFCQREGGRKFQIDQQAISEALRSVRESQTGLHEPASLDELFRFRLRAQSEFLRSSQIPSSSTVQGIRDDFDNRYSIGYFLLDCALLPSACTILQPETA
ncbi:hypothetical protein [Streptomyces mirabilis]|uniref:hypothetical protein n=1 Tax=Streptomyces mirabilis TaxID=68239 RepID=UPI00364F6C0F